MRYFADYHCHSDFSPDGRQTVEELCRAAVRAGLDEVCVTDHTDVNGWDFVPYDFRIPELMAEIERAREIFDGRLTVTAGTELGQPLQNEELAAEVTAGPYDFVIGSLHNLAGMCDFGLMEYRDEGHCVETLERYMAELDEHVKLGDFDVLGHITYPLRYMRAQGFMMTFDRFKEQVREILRTVIGRGKGIEINTSGLRGGLGETLPPLETVRLYRELGGEVLTIGSDAHRQEDIGSGIAEAQELAMAAGFRYFTVFRGRKPEFIKL